MSISFASLQFDNTKFNNLGVPYVTQFDILKIALINKSFIVEEFRPIYPVLAEKKRIVSINSSFESGLANTAIESINHTVRDIFSATTTIYTAEAISKFVLENHYRKAGSNFEVKIFPE